MRMLQSLYEQHATALLRYLRRMFADAAAAEDVLQETFVRAAAKPERLEDADCPRAWLFAVARNVGLTQLRRRPCRPLPPAATAPADADVDRRETAEQVWAAIERLPTEMRETLELRLRDDLSYAEIAVVLEIPVGTVRSRLHHAVRKLRGELEAGQ
ncbi:ECF RNA polymerase sigma factor SigL [Phycisphaerae bacterium RAS1]|nr:ECF RNA polymerase sigma factor SigL [Phycisphaerae bacterium RAS1]